MPPGLRQLEHDASFHGNTLFTRISHSPHISYRLRIPRIPRASAAGNSVAFVQSTKEYE